MEYQSGNWYGHTLLGSLNGGIVASGLDFRADGMLFASLNIVSDGGSGGDLLGIINTATGESTPIGPFVFATKLVH